MHREGSAWMSANILHDWSEEKNWIILNKVYDALSYGGGILLIETILEEEKIG